MIESLSPTGNPHISSKGAGFGLSIKDLAKGMSR